MSEQKQIYDAKQDPYYSKPFIDTDERRERELPNGTKTAYRYMHGGFNGTQVRFSFYFPPKENFKGHFFQYLSPFPGPNEEVASLEKSGEDDPIAFAVTHGAYFIETNMGSGERFVNNADPTIIFKSSAAAAEYSRVKAREIYECDRPFGYVYGGSGGGYKAMSCIENTNAWDGAVPYVIGSPASVPNCICVIAHGMRNLRNCYGKIVDALEPGGSGNIYEGLSVQEKSALKEVTSMGFPPRTWFMGVDGLINDGALPVLSPGVHEADPDYFKDFWTKPGYLGTEPGSSAQKDRIQFRSVVKSVHIPGEAVHEEMVDGRNNVNDAWQKLLTDGSKGWVELEVVPAGDDLYLNGVNICFESGEAEGKRLLLGSIVGNKLIIGMCYGMDDLPGVLSKVKPGDKVFLDNSDYIAIQTYYRHQVPDQSFCGWDQFRDKDGRPIPPQRSYDICKPFTYSGAGSVQDGDIQGKVIVISAVMDENAYPWQADWYRKKVAEQHGGNAGHIFRLWYMDHCTHGDLTTLEGVHFTNYMGTLHRALLAVSDWVEKGMEPIATTNYKIKDAQVILPETAAKRGGVQPVVELFANGSQCTRVKAGEEVKLQAMIEVPPKAGKAAAADFNFEGTPRAETEGVVFAHSGVLTLKGDGGSAVATATHVYQSRGTYFATVRVKSNPFPDGKRDVFLDTRNIARARIIVE